MLRWLKNLVHDQVDGSWFGFPNPRYMSPGVFAEELSFKLFLVGSALWIVMIATVVMLLTVPAIAFAKWPPIVIIASGLASTVINLIALFLPRFFK